MNDIERRALLGAAGAGALAAIASAKGGGPLNPPAGSVASTGRTLGQVEPRTPITSLPTVIVAPGSYYLTGNLSMSGNGHGITVGVGGVEIDLNGFSITGVSAAGSAAVYGASAPSDVTVRNGRLLNWWHGVDLQNVTRARIENVTCTGPIASGPPDPVGISVETASAVIDCGTRGFVTGIRANSNSLIRGCRSLGARDIGIAVNASTLIESCTVVTETISAASIGLYAAIGVVVRGCVFTGWGTGVLSASPQLAVLQCSILGSATTRGIVASSAALLAEDCQVTAGDLGILGGDASLVRNCTVANATFTRSAGTGVTTGNISRVEGCSVFAYQVGIDAGITATVERCTVNNCTNAVMVQTYAAVTGCTLDYGSVGVFTTGPQARIVDNKLSRFDPCINCGNQNSTLVARNQFSETGASPVVNANATCAVGPLLTAAGIATATNPWANVRI